MPVTIKSVDDGSIASQMGWKPGAQVLSINDKTISDVIDFRFYASDETLQVKVRIDGTLQEQHIEKDAFASLGVEVEDFRIKHCGDDCVFCFVDQNPVGLRDTLYFRDGDYRMSFLYGNYITMTNLRQRDLDRIVEQRLTPLYISVHCTNNEVRHQMMGHKNVDDQLLEKMQFLRENGIEMHTQIVLVPGFNDGKILQQTIEDLYAMNDAIESVSVVPVGITKHRSNLTKLRNVTPTEAKELVATVNEWQTTFRAEIGRGFVYLSDEMYLLADLDFPMEDSYDGYPLMENGVGMCRDFITEFEFQREEFPEAIASPKSITLVTAKLPATILKQYVLPALNKIQGLTATLVIAPNILFGPPVTVSGLLSYQCFYQALKDYPASDLLLLPPDCINFEGKFMDDRTPEDLAQALNMPVKIFDGDWVSLLEHVTSAP